MAEPAFTEERIQRILSGFLSDPKYSIDGLYVFEWESDKLLKSKSGYFYEFEIKISRGDFKADFKYKLDKHTILASPLTGEKYMPRFWKYYEKNKKNLELTVEQWEAECRKSFKTYFTDYYKLPNYFYYAVPEGLIKEEEVPEYAGLVYITDYGTIRVIKKAPKLHKKKYTDGELGLAEKFYYNFVHIKNRAERLEKDCIEAYKELNTELESKNQEKTYMQMKWEMEYYKNQEKTFETLFIEMVFGADYNDIERRLLITEVKKRDPGFDYDALIGEACRLYDERYPDRKKPSNK